MDDVQSWWEVPCIAHFCSLFRLYFDLIDFDIEELEEALLTDSAEEVASSLLQDLIVRLLKGCFNTQRDEITSCNYQMYLRRLFRKKCEEGSTKNNPFDKDAAFHSLPLRTKVEILYDLCDFRLDNDDVPDSLNSLEADSLRVEALGQDSGESTYWYFYGTRLYREDYTTERTTVSSGQKRGRGSKAEVVEKEISTWQVVCYTEEDWQLLTRKFKNCKSFHERNLHRTLRDDFLPELPRLFAEKERLQRKRMMEKQLRRSGRVPLTDGTKEEMPVSTPKKSSPTQSSNDSKDKKIKSENLDEENSEIMDEDEARRQREEQEKADRLLAEEIEREERKARLHLRERRGGGGGGSSSGFSGSGSLNSFDKASNLKSKSSRQRKGSGSRSSSANKSPTKSSSPSKGSRKEKDKKKKRKKTSGGGGRMTNNSLAASLTTSSKSGGESGDEVEQPNDCDDDNDVNDDKDDNASESGDRVKLKKKVAEEKEKCRSRSSSPSSSVPPLSKKPKTKGTSSSLKSKKKKSSGGGHEDSSGEKVSKSKDKSKDKKKRKLKHKDKSKDKDRGKVKEKVEKSVPPKEKSGLDTNHMTALQAIHSTGGMSKTKVKSSVLFSQTEEDVQIGMHKVIESIKNHGDAWPFMNPVDEDYAPNYYRVISSPMDLQTMEDKLDNQEYCSLEEFVADFQRIVDNCTKYNGPSSEYTEMAETLQEAFNKAIKRFIVPDESDEEISIEYNNMEIERKRPRLQSVTKKEEKAPPEHKKENDPTIGKKSAPVNKSKNNNKYDKKKMKHKLMRHHSRNSEAIENLDTATAETLKDINKWLGDTPKPSEYLSSSPGSLASDNIKTRIPEDENDSSVLPNKKSSLGHKRKAVSDNKSSSRSPSRKLKDRIKEEDDDGDEDFTPPKKMFKKSDKHASNDSKLKNKRNNKEKSSERGSSKKSSSIEKYSGGKEKEKDKHSSSSYHRHHKHHHSGSSSSKRESSPKNNNKLNGSTSSSSGSSKHSDHHNNSTRGERDHHRHSPKDQVVEKSSIKQSKSMEDKKSNKAPVKRQNSLFNSLKNSTSMKRLQQVNKTTKFNSFNSESKFKQGSGGGGGEVFGSKGPSGDYFPGGQNVGRDNGLLGEKPEKKKCLLLNDNPTDREGGPRLSLGSVLSTDAIKLGEFKKDEVFSDDDYETNISSNPKPKLKSESNESEQVSQKVSQKENDNNEKVVDTKVSAVIQDTKENENDAEKEEDVETDRKLEPSKGFNREKCMPNLSAWIKAFGGPAKAAPGLSANSPQIKKHDPESKNKFKVMGRGVGESNVVTTNETFQKGQGLPRHSPGPKSGGKHQSSDPSWNAINHNPSQTSVVINSMKPGEHPPHVINLSDEMSSNDTHHTNKKHRHRKMSTSSLSSQSESGSPHCFINPDGTTVGSTVVNPPRWVDEHWTQSHSQSQSPSASSHVSSQSPANSPFSPAMNSPPHTPQTPPRPVGPVRVGFYQDITSQHSSPEKLTEPHSNSNSNVASPSTPPTPTNNSTNSSRRGGEGGNNSNTGSGKAGYGSYPTPVYAPRYASGTPSPNVGPGSNLQSPSPGGANSVESPGNPNSPHSPNVSNVSSNNNNNLPEYRNPQAFPQAAQQQSQPAHQPSASRQTPAAHQQQPSAHRGSASILNPHPHGSHSPAPSIAPYPPPVSHYGHPSAMSQPHPENAHSGQQISQAHQPAMAHMNQVQAHSQLSHQQHYERYPPHNLAHHQMSPQTSMPTSSSSGASSVYSQNMTAAHSQRPSTVQPSPYQSNPYASNPRSINIPPNVYNNPISSDPAMNRFYKATVSSGELSLTAGMSASSAGSNDPATTSSSSRGRNSRANAAASLVESEIQRSAAAANLEGKLSHGELNGFQWPHNLASLSQIVNSIPNPMNAVGMANAYRQYDQAMAESISKYQRADPAGYTNLSASSGGGLSGSSSKSGTTAHPPAAHSQSNEKTFAESNSESTGSSSSRRSSKSSESKATRSQGSSKGSSAQSIVPGSAFNFSTLSPADLALYPKEMTEAGSLYSASPPGLAHRPDLYPTSSSNFHPSFPTTARTTAGGTPSITPYQIPPFIGSHPSPYQPQSVSSQPFAHTQPPRGLTVDPYQQFFQNSPHVMGLLPPSGYPYPHGLGFNRPGWI